MEIKVKKFERGSIVRIEGKGEIKELFVNEDILASSGEKISICFKGDNISGIIDFSKEEIDKLDNTIKKKLNFIKDIKMLVGDRPSDEYLMLEKKNNSLPDLSSKTISKKSKKSGKK